MTLGNSPQESLKKVMQYNEKQQKGSELASVTSKRKAQITCFQCGGKEHYTKDCTSQKSVNSFKANEFKGNWKQNNFSTSLNE